MRQTSLILALCLLLGVSAAASAQGGAYVELTGAGLSQTVNGGSNLYFGPVAGLQFEKGHALRLGGDLRGMLLSDSGAEARSVVFGPRVSVHAPVLPIKPYGELLIGLGSLKPANSNSYNNHVEYDVVLGIDSTILPHLDWRVLEYAHAGYWSSGLNARNQFSTGLVVRFF